MEKSMSGLSRNRVTIPPYSVASINFENTKPNYYRVQNTGKTPIYCGTSHVPTTKVYDFMCNAESMKMYAEPYHRQTLYFYNPSGSEIIVSTVTFSAEFDPLTLALSEISIDLPTADLGLSTVVSSFESALPAGENKIGKVDVSKLPDEYVTLLNNILTAIVEKNFNANITGDVSATIDNTDVIRAINNKQIDHTAVISAINNKQIDHSAIISAINNLSFDNSDVVEAINNLSFDNSDVVEAVNASVKPAPVTNIGADKTVSGYGTETISAGSGKKITCIDFVSNDGEKDVLIEFAGVSISVKSGEVINNVKCYTDSIRIANDNNSSVKVRYLVTVEAV